MLRDGGGSGFLQRAFRTGLVGGQQRQRVAVAARGDEVDRRQLFGLGQVGHQHGGSARLFEPCLDAGDRLLGDRRVEAGYGRRIGRPEHRLGGGEPDGGIVRSQRQRAEQRRG